MTKLYSKLRQYAWNWFILIDQAFNVLLGGDPDETISSRVSKRGKEHCIVCWWLCKALHLIDPGHCEKVAEKDRGSRSVIK